jgi:hypothetical protein
MANAVVDTSVGGDDGEAQVRQDLQRAFRRDRQARQGFDIGRVEQDRTGRGRSLAGHDDLRGLAAAQLQDQLGGQFQARHDRAGVDRAGEPVLGVAVDAGGAAGLGGADRVEPGAFDEDVDGVVRAAGAFAAHHAAHADRAVRPKHRRSRDISGVMLVGLAVQGDQVLVAVRGLVA